MSQENNNDVPNAGTGDAADRFLKKQRRAQQEAAQQEERDKQTLALQPAREAQRAQQDIQDTIERLKPDFHIYSITTMDEGDAIFIVTSPQSAFNPYFVHMDVNENNTLILNVFTDRSPFSTVKDVTSESTYYQSEGQIAIYPLEGATVGVTPYGGITDKPSAYTNPLARTSILLTAANIALEKLSEKPTRDAQPTITHHFAASDPFTQNIVRKNFPSLSSSLDPEDKFNLIKKSVRQALLQSRPTE